jgi:ferredoxin-NADP reductase
MQALVSAPRNNFPLAEAATRHLLVAGGIGITPLLAMARHLAATGAEFTLHYCAASDDTPLLDEARAVCGPRLITWFKSGSRRFDAAEFGPADPGTHIYACGPQRLLDAIRRSTRRLGWPEAQLHVEIFQPISDENFKPEPFDVRLVSSDEILHVPADRSLLDVLRDHGIPMPSSCELGICGACECGYSDGIVIHRDQVLPLAARQDRMTPCVSRARVSITLDL